VILNYRLTLPLFDFFVGVLKQLFHQSKISDRTNNKIGESGRVWGAMPFVVLEMNSKKARMEVF